MIEEVTQVDYDDDPEDDALADDRDTGEVVVLFPEMSRTSAVELRDRLAEVEEERQALRHQVNELEDFNREAAVTRERVFMRMRRELARRHCAIDALEAEVAQLRAERDALLARARDDEQALADAGLSHRDAVAELEQRHRAELQRLHERAVRALTLQWLALSTS